MTNADNPQSGNVGNLGDILKHAALTRLAQVLGERRIPRVNYLDTHAFQFIARPANRNWHGEVDALLREYPDCRAYRDLQAGYVAQEKYLCSSAVVAECLPVAALCLSERNAHSRGVLGSQLSRRGIAPAALLDGVAAWADAEIHIPPSALLALIDPFAMDEVCWRDAWRAVHRLWAPDDAGVVLVFDYDKKVDAIEWPAAPRPWGESVARIARNPFHLACYASPAMREPVGEALCRLGWET